MALPFTQEEFMQVFRNYNESIWPFQVILNIIALVAIFYVVRNDRYSDQIVFGILGALWIWTGIVYYLLNFSDVYTGAYLFGTLYIIQGLVFFYSGIISNSIQFDFEMNSYTIIGLALILYALVIYPVIGHLLGHTYPEMPTFGAPCPLTIFTFGVLLLATSSISLPVLAIPLLWSFVGLSAAVNYKIWEDIMLVISGIVGTALIYYRNSNLG